MKPFLTKITLLFLSLTFITSCAHLEKLVHKPEVQLEKVSVHSISKSGLVLKLKLKITNKNSFNLKINNFTLSGSIQDKTLITQKLDHAINLVANKPTSVDMPVTIEFKSLLDSIASITRLNKVGYKIQGKLTVQDYFDIPYSKKGDIELSK